MKYLNDALIKLALKLVHFYQLLPLSSHASCRFYPTCSRYTYEAIQKYGILKGSFLGLKRILKCHPFSLSGYDPLT